MSVNRLTSVEDKYAHRRKILSEIGAGDYTNEAIENYLKSNQNQTVEHDNKKKNNSTYLNEKPKKSNVSYITELCKQVGLKEDDTNESFEKFDNLSSSDNGSSIYYDCHSRISSTSNSDNSEFDTSNKCNNISSKYNVKKREERTKPTSHQYNSFMV